MIKVLLVDDHVLIRDGIRAMLSKSKDIEVVSEAGDGESAVDIADSLKPDVIMMDLLMPVLDGISAIRRLKSHKQTKHIPIIVFTTECSIEDKVKALEAGASDFLSKEADEAELIARVKSLLRVKTLEDGLLREKKKLSSILNDLAEAVVILDNDDQVILFAGQLHLFQR